MYTPTEFWTAFIECYDAFDAKQKLISERLPLDTASARWASASTRWDIFTTHATASNDTRPYTVTGYPAIPWNLRNAVESVWQLGQQSSWIHCVEIDRECIRRALADY
jgi:hypothetical protein